MTRIVVCVIAVAIGAIVGCQRSVRITMEENGKVLCNGKPLNDSKALASHLANFSQAGEMVEIDVANPQVTTCGQLSPILLACHKSGQREILLNDRRFGIADVSEVTRQPDPEEDASFFPSGRMEDAGRIANDEQLRCVNDFPARLCPTTTTRVSLLLSMVDELKSKGFQCGLGPLTLTQKAQWAGQLHLNF